MAGLYYEDFVVGKEYRHEWSRTVTETDTILYTSITMNPAPIHLDEHYMKTTIHGQRLVPSLYTAGLIGGMIVHDLTLGTTLGNLGYTKFDFPKPVSTATPCGPSRPSWTSGSRRAGTTPASCTSSTAASTSAARSCTSPTAPA